MAQVPGLDALTKDVHEPSTGLEQASDMAFAEL
jgi:hypothetical protein